MGTGRVEAPLGRRIWGRGQKSPCAGFDSAVVPPTGGSFLQSHSTSPPRTAEASEVGGRLLSHVLLPSKPGPRPQPESLPFSYAPPTAYGPRPSRRPLLQSPHSFPGRRGIGGAPNPRTCAEGNWGTASLSRPCSWEWMLARARWDRVSLCEKTEGGRRTQWSTPL